MTRDARLQVAKKWVSEFNGRNYVRGYAKWYGVDKICAIHELRMLGIKIDDKYEKSIRQAIEATAEQRRKRRIARKQKEHDELYSDADDYFAHVAGYTPGGVAYGVTWEELGEEPPWSIENDPQ